MGEAVLEKDWKLLEPHISEKVFLTVLFSIMLVVGIVGNSVTIETTNLLRRKGYLQKNVTDHMVSLACSDLLVLLIGMPVELSSAIWNTMSATGDTSCKVYNFLFETCSYATLLNVATMSFERFMAICYPFRYKSLSGRRTAYLILFAWLTSVLVALPTLFATGIEVHLAKVGDDGLMENLTFCTYLSGHWTMYQASIWGAFVVYILVLGLVAFMCRSMIQVIKKAAGSVSKTESAQVKTARKQTIIFLGLIVLALVICWFPNQVRRLMTATIPKNEWTASYLKTYIVIHRIGDTFFYLSSVINPFLYNLSSSQFRQVFLQVLLCRRSAVEHKNRKNLSGWSVASKSSAHPLMSKSRRKQDSSADKTAKWERKTEPPEHAELVCSTPQSDSGIVMSSSACTPVLEEAVKLQNDSTQLGNDETEI